MEDNITPNKLYNKNIDELTLEEMIFIHLSTDNTPIDVKNARLRSTLSFIYQNIQHSLHNEYSKQLIPYLSLCAILEQLGVCYNINDKFTKYDNGIKRCLFYFGDVAEDDEFMDIICALRNGLLHNVSLTSYNKYKTKYYFFRFDDDIDSIYKSASIPWDGSYDNLDGNGNKYITYINTNKFVSLVSKCIQTAASLNQQSLLKLRLEGGVKQLFFDYIHSKYLII